MELNDYAIRLFKTIEDVDSFKLFGDSATLSGTEVRLLREVVSERSKGRDIISSELARRIGVTRSAVSQLVTKLEERDILVRTAAPDDKKIAYIRLSEHALTAFEAQCREINGLLEACVEKFGKDRARRLSVDAADFIDLMKKGREERFGKTTQN